MRTQPFLWMALLFLTLVYPATSAAASPAHPQPDPAPRELRQEQEREVEKALFFHGDSSALQLIADAKAKSAAPAARAPGERPLPAFSGRTLAGTRLSMTGLIGKRVLFFFFNPEIEGAGTVATAVSQVAKLGQSHNFRVVGIGVGSSTYKVRAFAKKYDLDFSIIDDSNAEISSLLRIPSPLFIIGADAEGYMSFVVPGFDTNGEDAVERIVDKIKESLRIRTETVPAGPLIDHPKAPMFTTQDINGKPFDLASLKGKPIVLIFFLHTCPHCHHALAFFRDQLKKIPEAKRPALVGISLQNRPSTVRNAMARENLDFFTPLMDPGQEILQSYGVAGGVPDISMINSEGEIIYRSNGWRDGRDPALMRMYLAKIADERIPMLLSKKGYAGNDVCSVCHEEQAATWELTSHAQAYGTLVTHGKERDAECVSCHVVGFDEPGGFSFARPEKYLENVGCESCHGRGGPHLSPDFLKEGGYENACVQCHDKKHSLGFDFATFLPNVSHTMIANMTAEQRAERFGAEASFSRPLLPTQADYVGSDACESCHTAEFATWKQSPHARAVATLEAKQKAGDGECLSCHTTGYGRPGGFPKDGLVSAHPDLASVGCESCHGPGGDHIAADAPKFGTILSLGDKCDSCVILQICGSCHDDANDPDFTFEVEAHIERQRHGTTEPGTGKPLGPTAVRSREENRVAEALRWIQSPG